MGRQLLHHGTFRQCGPCGCAPDSRKGGFEIDQIRTSESGNQKSAFVANRSRISILKLTITHFSWAISLLQLEGKEVTFP